MKLQWSCRATVIAVLVAWLVVAVWPSRAQAVSFGGQATGAQVFVPATGLTIKAASGELPPTGGEVDASLLSGDIPGSATGGVVALAAGTLHSVVVGLDETDAEASLANMNLTVSGNGFTSDFVMARSSASCGPAVAGGSQLQNLVINGQPITVTGTPNQTVSLPNGTATINEQVPAVGGSTADLRVVALHVTTIDAVTGQVLADVQLAIADAMIDCQPGSGPSGNFVTGGGWIVGQSGGKGTFGVVGGTRPDGTDAGHVVYIDHGNSFTLHSASVSTSTSICTSTITGSGDSSSGPAQFSVTVHDDGEPGTTDTFEIHVRGLFPPYDAFGTLSGGNIQVHRSCP